MQQVKMMQNNRVSLKKAARKRERRPSSTKTKVESELKTLRAITKNAIPEEQRAIALKLLPNIAFLKIKLDESRLDLMDSSIITRYDNGGGQSGIREHPGFTAYNKLLTTFCRAVKQLIDMMPSESSEADQLIEYTNGTRQK